MILKWTNNSKYKELLFLDNVSKFVLVGKTIMAADCFTNGKYISVGVFKNEEEALRVFDEIIKRLNDITDEDQEEVFDTQEFLDNGYSNTNNDDWA